MAARNMKQKEKKARFLESRSLNQRKAQLGIDRLYCYDSILLPTTKNTFVGIGSNDMRENSKNIKFHMKFKRRLVHYQSSYTFYFSSTAGIPLTDCLYLFLPSIISCATY